MKSLRWSAGLAALGIAALLSGCVVAPVATEPYPYSAYGPVYVAPPPVVVVPSVRFGFGHHRGHHHGHRHGFGHGQGHWR